MYLFPFALFCFVLLGVAKRCLPLFASFRFSYDMVVVMMMMMTTTMMMDDDKV